MCDKLSVIMPDFFEVVLTVVCLSFITIQNGHHSLNLFTAYSNPFLNEDLFTFSFEHFLCVSFPSKLTLNCFLIIII